MCKLCLFARILFIFVVIAAGLFLWREAHGAEIAMRINEVAWMGTEVSANDEWIELFNASGASIDLSGWQLRAQDGSPKITLAGSIPPGGYMLLERTDDSTLPTIAAHQIYTGALANDGEILELVDAQGLVQDSVDAASGWLAGDNATKATMERDDDGFGWHTGPAGGTPRAKNSVPAPPPTVIQEQESGEMSIQRTRVPLENTSSQQSDSPVLAQKKTENTAGKTLVQTNDKKSVSSSGFPMLVPLEVSPALERPEGPLGGLPLTGLADIGTNNGESFARDLQKNAQTRGIPPFFIAGGIILALIIAVSMGIVLATQHKKE